MSCVKVLFVLKYRDNYSEFVDYGYGRSSGLSNSARFVHDMLVAAGIESKVVHVTDNNDIDREVYRYKPSHVVIEALWVVPEKFDILQKLHPSVKWIVRGHSEIPFLANEGNAIEWVRDYVTRKNVWVASNSRESVQDLKIAVGPCHQHKVIYLPNYYPVPDVRRHKTTPDGFINVACLGAIRPLKNQLIQAIAAIAYADKHKLFLRFHINGSRKEQGGNSNHQNIESLFKNTGYELVQHDWVAHDTLLKLLTKMDVSLNVSLSETFNIVAADSVSQRVPVVCSSEVEWTSPFCQAQPTSSADIVRKMETVLSPYTGPAIKQHNLLKLKMFSKRSQWIWIDWLIGE